MGEKKKRPKKGFKTGTGTSYEGEVHKRIAYYWAEWKKEKAKKVPDQGKLNKLMEKIGVRASYEYFMSKFPSAKLIGAFQNQGVYDLVFQIQRRGKPYLLFVEAKAGLGAKLGGRMFKGVFVFQNRYKYLVSIAFAMLTRDKRGKIKNYRKLPDRKFVRFINRIYPHLTSGNYSHYGGFIKRTDTELLSFHRKVFSGFENKKRRMIHFRKFFEALAKKKTLNASDEKRMRSAVKEFKDFYEPLKGLKNKFLERESLRMKASLYHLYGKTKLGNSVKDFYPDKSKVRMPHVRARRRNQAAGAGLGFFELFTVIFNLVMDVKASNRMADERTAKILIEGAALLRIYVKLGTPLPNIILVDSKGQEVFKELEKNDKYSLIPEDFFTSDTPFTMLYNPIVLGDDYNDRILIDTLYRKRKGYTLTTFHQLMTYKTTLDQFDSHQLIGLKRIGYQNGKVITQWVNRYWKGGQYDHYNWQKKYVKVLDEIYEQLKVNQKNYLKRQRKFIQKGDQKYTVYSRKSGKKDFVLKSGEPYTTQLAGNLGKLTIPLNFETWWKAYYSNQNKLRSAQRMSGGDFYWLENYWGGLQ